MVNDEQTAERQRIDETVAWSTLTECLQAFVEAWETAAEPPQLQDHLPEDGPLRRSVLPELVKVDLKYRWTHAREPRRLEDYLADFPELGQGGVSPDLVYEEYHLRCQSGAEVDVAEYQERFPELAGRLAAVLQTEVPYFTTAVATPQHTKPLDEIEVGATVDEFQLLAELGRGAFARVFLARQQSMQRLVALKVSCDEGDEPQTMAQIDHDYIVRVFDQRGLAPSNLRLLYMQYVAGGTLSDVLDDTAALASQDLDGRNLLKTIDRQLERHGESPPVESSSRAELSQLSWPETVAWLGLRLALALDHAHKQGILHRDVKPANVLLAAEGVPKLADFNVSFSARIAGATPAAYFGGSLPYMSPEQLEAFHPLRDRRPDELDGRSDQYSLGVLLCELLTGERPFHDATLRRSWNGVLDEMIELRQRDGSAEVDWPPQEACSRLLVDVIKKCLAPRPEDRWSDCAELARQLKLCLHPQARELFSRHQRPAYRLLCRHFTLVAVAAILAPNALAAVFAYAYNYQRMSGETILWFDRLKTIINGIAFPAGAAIGLWLLITVSDALRRDPAEQAASAEKQRKIRRRCLRLGVFAALIGVFEWALAGIAYPVTLHWATAQFSAASYAHFIASHLLCGLMAAAYPFFGVTLLSLRFAYPRLLAQDLSAVSGDRRFLAQLQPFTWCFLTTAFAVPLVAVTVLVLIGSQERFALGVMSGVGLLSLAPALWCFHWIQTTVATLLELGGGELGRTR